jgi:hypothetical protein
VVQNADPGQIIDLGMPPHSINAKIHLSKEITDAWPNEETLQPGNTQEGIPKAVIIPILSSRSRKAVSVGKKQISKTNLRFISKNTRLILD